MAPLPKSLKSGAPIKSTIYGNRSTARKTQTHPRLTNEKRAHWRVIGDNSGHK
jgi:hypothetical protein